ncbi:CPBP family intramembrane glutamic endopeptidase [Larkinella rosea]|uniref:CPBP family intramembrane metalloprotease n=1 Tax=Larkinella rosea TaxID=2025312 RepID=A0A3P1BAU5_9BACT|nr:CPBP family intramembrane glutamic endopeptidase [Larkinella rosea]RRA98041.1 CPBP family intramembrane metalloprotease [Larkinella rosea]
MKNAAIYFRELRTGAVLTTVFFALFLYYNRQLPLTELLPDSPFFIALFFLTFTIGQPQVSEQLKQKIGGCLERAAALPVLLIGLLYAYLGFHGHAPFKGSAALFFFYLLFPVLGFLAYKKPHQPVNWTDFIIYFLFLIPATSISFGTKTNLPFNGSGFSNVLKFVLILTAVYSFSTIRHLPDIGFFPTFNWKYLKTAIGVWLAFIALTTVIATASGFLKTGGYEPLSLGLMPVAVGELVRIFFGTALFEEVFLRGILQNMLARKITESGVWKTYWKWGFAVFLLLSLLTGYLMHPTLLWVPVLITVLLFLAAYFIENKAILHGPYTSLAITSVFFGLVHFHAGSLVFVGLASIAGWGYGYTYLKTKNVFYAALVHTLVNASEFLFQLDGLK